MRSIFHPLSFGLALATCTFFASHAAEQTPGPKSVPGEVQIRAARDEVITLRSNIFLTLVVLDQVRGESEVRGVRYQAFTNQLQRMEGLAQAMGKRTAEMKERGDAYFQDWEATVSAVQDPEARQRIASRYAERKKSYDAIRTALQQAKESFLPFLSDLGVIKTLLEGPRDAKSVAAARNSFMSANWRCIDVQRALMETETDLDQLAASFARDD